MFSKTNIKDLQLAKVKRNVKLVDSNGIPIHVSTGELYLPFGASCWENKRNDFSDYSVQCYTTKTEGFETFCQELSDKIEELCLESPLFDTDSVPVVYIGMLKKNKDFPQLLKINLPRDRYGNFDFVVFDHETNKVMVTEDNVNEIFCKKRSFKCIMECSRVWEFNGKIGSVWNIVQAKTSPMDSGGEAVEDDGTDESSVSNSVDAGATVYTECML